MRHKWDADRCSLVANLSAGGLSPAEIAAQIGFGEGALRYGMARYGLAAEDLHGTRMFTTAGGRKVRRQVKPKRPAKVSLAKGSLGEG